MDVMFSALSNLARFVFGAWPVSTTVALAAGGVGLILTGFAGRVVLWVEAMLLLRSDNSAFVR